MRPSDHRPPTHRGATPFERAFSLIAVTPAGTAEPSIAIAASRAGELGVLDLDHVEEARDAKKAIARMARYAPARCGVKLGCHDPGLTREIASELPDAVELVIVSSPDPESLRELVPILTARGPKVLLEVTDSRQAEWGESLGVHGLIAKGHEAGGWVGEETSFVLLQRLLSRSSLPVWAHGGIGLHSAAACYAAGAAGIVLDAQLALVRESLLPADVQSAIRRMDGSETVCLGGEVGAPCRMYARPGSPVLATLQARLQELDEDEQPRSRAREEWRDVVRRTVAGAAPEAQPWLFGQDVAFAHSLADRFLTVAGVLEGIRRSVVDHVETARRLRPLDERGSLAASHGTRYPIVQGPMTRVSDCARFAEGVAEGGGLPFLALALMRAPEIETLLRQTKESLGDRPWGVGVLGFVPLELRREQLKVVEAYRPPFALIAGGRPDQARALEKQGIPTYLHVPSPGLLELFLRDGARRFVFEGRECGGHVGPRSSFVLWNLMVDVLLESLPAGQEEDCHVLFAGGIHDGVSASMVAALAAPLSERGVRVGVLLGTAYLFTQEAVESGAILPGFQQEAVRCDRTVLLETGPGHSTRCADTTFADFFRKERRRLSREGKSPEEIRNTLELLNIGRLRVASKGLKRNTEAEAGENAPRLVEAPASEQHSEGMYMIGQVAALRDRTCSIEELHRAVSVDGTRRLAETSAEAEPAPAPEGSPSEVAIIGMSCHAPKASDLETYWSNILNKVDAIGEIPKSRWDWELYFDPDPNAPDKIYSKWGGFLDDEPFDPVEFGMPPNSLRSIDPMQLLALKAAREALADAGYWDRDFDRAQTSVILGASGGTGDLGAGYNLRASLPLVLGELATEIISRAEDRLPEWTEDSFAGLLLNVTAGRIANRLDLGGVNYIVDAACASSLAAVQLAVRELETGNSDMVIVGGVDTVQNPFGYLCFSKTRALSPTGRPRTFDASADGIAISEGIVMLVLKRLSDAERDGDRIYAVIQGLGGSSDGKAKGMTAPRPEGQVLALERAYAKAGSSPASVGLFEAHGTGTVVGDRAEALALTNFLEGRGAAPASAAIGSVKSMIGHTKATAGVAGLAKVALALHHRVLPPTLGVSQPNPAARFGEGPLYVNTETRPWLHRSDRPRRAGVSAFGFGGTNFHAVVDEYRGDYLPRGAVTEAWPSELFVWSAASRGELSSALSSLEAALADGAAPRLRDLAYSLWVADSETSVDGDGPGERLSIVATSLSDLRSKLSIARGRLDGEAGEPKRLPTGIYFHDEPLGSSARIAFLFPGQGSQYPDMLSALAVHFEEVRESFELTDRVLEDFYPAPLSSYVYPPPVFDPEAAREQQRRLTQTNVAQPALGAANMGVFALLGSLNVRPDMVAGHSYGEYGALCAAGAIDAETLARLSEARGRYIVEAATRDLGTMAAVDAGPDAVRASLGSLEGVWIANRNAPRQTILSGTREGIERAVELLRGSGMSSRPVPVACAFHSPLVAPARASLAEFLSTVPFTAPRIPVFSNTTASPYPSHPRDIAALLADHLVQPVRFDEEIEAMYEAGARIFVEVGPRNVLVGLARQILRGRPHEAIAIDAPKADGLGQLQHALARLVAHGAPVRLDRLFRGRSIRRLNLAALAAECRPSAPSPTTWIVNGGSARPFREALGGRTRKPITISLPGPNGPPAEPTDTEGVREIRHVQPDAPRAPNGKASAPANHPPAAGRPLAESGDGSAISAEWARAPRSRADDQVVAQFQKTMSRFLETQKHVMLAYLQGQGDASLAEAENGQASTSLEPASVADPVPEPAPASAPAPSDSPGDDEVAAVPAAPPPGAERPNVTRDLLGIVSDRTGYPADMLDLDVDIEAELGIDSIKRVEILGALQHTLPEGFDMPEGGMEHLTGIKTLGGIAGWLEEALGGKVRAAANGSNGHAPASLAPAGESEAGAGKLEGAAGERAGPAVDAFAGVPRAVRALIDAPAPPIDERFRFPSGGVLVVTEDGRGVTTLLAARIREAGGRVACVRPAGGESSEEDVFSADLADPAAVAALVASLRGRYGRIDGIVHLSALQEESDWAEMDLADWKRRLQREVKSLFYLASAAREDLDRPGAEEEPRWLLAATAMGGGFGVDAAAPGSFPGQGGLAGVVKTLALEWPSARCRIVDLDPSSSPSMPAEHLFRELATRDAPVEVGYRGAERRVLQPVPAPLDETETQLAVESDWVILVTGGARGITAEVACELAERYRPTLVLIGRSPRPSPEEPAATRSLDSEAELKKRLMEQMKESGERASLPRIEAAYRRLMKDREIRLSLARMERAGATVRYHEADVCDEGAMKELLTSVYRELGRIDGVVHGAGVIEDKLVGDKTPESFDRVFDVKADSVFLLARLLDHDSLKFVSLFSSASGAFGNRGQCDYAAANEVMNKLAAELDRRWSARVVAINWGPWRKTGMVSQELQKEFERRGVQLISLEEGRRVFERELRLGRKGTPEILVAGAGDRTSLPESDAEAEAHLPLLERARFVEGGGHVVEAERTLDPAHDLYLSDHQMDGHPVLPMAMALELMAEVVQKGWPDLKVVAVRDLRVLKGLVLDRGPKTVRIVARAPVELAPDRVGADVPVEIRDAANGSVTHYRATVELAAAIPEAPPAGRLPAANGLRPFPLPVEEAYRRWLFHGPIFQGIRKIEGIGDREIAALLDPSTPARCLKSGSSTRWLFDPVILDSGLQLFILWARASLDKTPLPNRLLRYRRFGPMDSSAVRCKLRVSERSRDPVFYIDIRFLDGEGRLVALLEEMEGTCTAALNRLGSQDGRTPEERAGGRAASDSTTVLSLPSGER